jgi:hypothetical protein
MYLSSWQLQNSFGKLGIGGKLKEKEKKEEPKVRDIYRLQVDYR